LAVVNNYLQNSNISQEGLRLRDGSGLSRKNLVTTTALASNLLSATYRPWFNDYYTSFPVAGETGSISNMFKKTLAAGNLRAKSGTLEGVKAFCGYTTTAGGRQLVYSLIINNYSGSQSDITQEMEKLLVKMCEATD
jgi:serine-type D-Ala-D-Ala carboxypeptidase/endopeptidase (penicillin-binding protein 4)